mmetsp:Transcript_159087/g.296385  ORF Transcript_159087/g.296385 Transcript_159087/m.296385 type:complete len:105 (-) Transcript_159087:40-354(-)
MPRCAVAAVVAAMLLACGLGQSYVQAPQRVIEFDDDAELDWTAGSVLGLQRSYTVHRRGEKPADKPKPVGAFSLAEGSAKVEKDEQQRRWSGSTMRVEGRRKHP